jgi:putative zinc finger/helix-turn-helix YgiT family protein
MEDMKTRAFSKKCAECRQKTMALATIPYTIRIDHDGRKYDVSLPAMIIPRCSNCGAISIDAEAEKQISDAFHKQAGLLTPDEILLGRESLGLTQKEMSDLLGIADATLSRWETGVQVQQRSFDKFLRAFFASPALRKYFQSLQAAEAGEASHQPLAAAK